MLAIHIGSKKNGYTVYETEGFKGPIFTGEDFMPVPDFNEIAEQVKKGIAEGKWKGKTWRIAIFDTKRSLNRSQWHGDGFIRARGVWQTIAA